MSASIYYDQIMELPGLEEMKAVVQQWDQVAKNLPHHSTNIPLVLPDLLWKTRPGAGKTHFLQLLSDYLQASRLLDFYGDVQFLEFYLEYCPPDAYLSELTRLIADVRAAAGFRSEYRGILVLDISAWEKGLEEDHFLRVLEYLSSIDHKVCIIYIAEDFPQEANQKLEQVLNGYCRVRSVDFSYPEPGEFAAYCAKWLLQYQLQLDKGAQKMLADSISALMKWDYFDGYKTVNRLCQDIAFDLCSLPDVQKKPVTAKQLAAYHKDGPFVKNMSRMIKLRSIGFGGER